MEERNVYEIVGSLDQQGARNEQRIRNCDSKVYMVPNAAMFDDESQYEELQISTHPPVASKRKPIVPTKQHASQSVDSVTRQNTITSTGGNNNKIKGTQKRRGSRCAVVSVLLTMLAVIIIVALAIGALGFRGSSRAQLALDVLEEDTLNHTSYLLDEIRALNNQLAQLHADAQSNISHLLKSVSQLSRSASQVSTSVRQLSTSASQQSTSAYQASTSVSRLSTSARSLSISVYSVSSSASRLSTSGYSLSSSVSRHRYSSHYSISTSVRQLSTSVSRLSSSFVNRCTTYC